MTTPYGTDQTSLVDLLDRVIGSGVAINGDLVLSLAGIDLVYLGLRSVLAPANVVPIEKRVLGHVTGGAPPDEFAGEPLGPASRREAQESALTTGVGDQSALPGERSSAPVGFDDDDSAQSGSQPQPQTAPESGGLPARAETADPDEIQRGLVQLVLTLVELIRQLMERQAIRRVEAGGLDDDQVERLGQALMMLEAAMADLRERFGVEPDDLNLDLGPLGRLL